MPAYAKVNLKVRNDIKVEQNKNVVIMDYNDMAAIGIVRLMLTDGVITKEIAGKYFPELKESDDGKIREKLIAFLSQCKAVYGDSFKQFDLNIDEALAWLEKQVEQQSTENKGMNIDEENMTPFQKKVFCIIDSTVEEEQGLKQVCDELLALASNEIEKEPAWSEEDEKMFEKVIKALSAYADKLQHEGFCHNKDVIQDYINWLTTIKYRVQSRINWKPSEEMLEALYRATPKNVKALSEDEMLLDKLYQGLKYGILSKN